MMASVSYNTIIQWRERSAVPPHSLSVDAPCLSPGVLHMSLRDGAAAVCLTVSVGGISGIPVCGRGLLPGSPSFCRLSQSCTLLPSLLLSPNRSPSCHAKPCFTLFFTQRCIPQSVTGIMTGGELRHLFS